MAQTNVNIRMDENLKKQFDIFCNEIGLNMSTAFNIFAKQLFANRGYLLNYHLIYQTKKQGRQLQT